MHRPPPLRLSSARDSSRSGHSRSRPRNPCSSCPRLSPRNTSFRIGSTDGTTAVPPASRKSWSGRQDSNLRPPNAHFSRLGHSTAMRGTRRQPADRLPIDTRWQIAHLQDRRKGSAHIGPGYRRLHRVARSGRQRDSAAPLRRRGNTGPAFSSVRRQPDQSQSA
jgi:hypothetical protein